MEVILLENILNLGNIGDKVKVKNGYGRNYLIPQGIAVLATESAKKMHEETIKQRAKKDAKLKADAEAIAAKIAELTVKVSAKAGETKKIFGSVNNIQVAEALGNSGAGLKDFSRIASSSPQMWADIFIENQENLLPRVSALNEVLSALESHLETRELRKTSWPCER